MLKKHKVNVKDIPNCPEGTELHPRLHICVEKCKKPI